MGRSSLLTNQNTQVELCAARLLQMTAVALFLCLRVVVASAWVGWLACSLAGLLAGWRALLFISTSVLGKKGSRGKRFGLFARYPNGIAYFVSVFGVVTIEHTRVDALPKMARRAGLTYNPSKANCSPVSGANQSYCRYFVLKTGLHSRFEDR